MKKLSKINLHNLSKAEMADRELNLLKGGSAYCISICLDAICTCSEFGDGSGNFPASDSVSYKNSGITSVENSVAELTRVANSNN